MLSCKWSSYCCITSVWTVSTYIFHEKENNAMKETLCWRKVRLRPQTAWWKFHCMVGFKRFSSLRRAIITSVKLPGGRWRSANNHMQKSVSERSALLLLSVSASRYALCFFTTDRCKGRYIQKILSQRRDSSERTSFRLLIALVNHLNFNCLTG